MTETDLAITVYYRDHEQPGLLNLIRELDELGVGYDECSADEIAPDVADLLNSKAGGELSFPALLINDDLILQPTSATVMSAIMNARSGGFYQ